MPPASTQPNPRFWRGRRVAITGATGFVGHHVAVKLREAGAEVCALVRPTSNRRRLVQLGVTCVEATLSDMETLARNLTGCEVVFHVAGAVGFRSDWEKFRCANVVGTQNVHEAAFRAGVRRIVHTSSIIAIGASKQPQMLDESTVWNLRGYKVAYATTKHEGEEAARQDRGREHEVVVVNPACVVGPNDHSRSEMGSFCRRFWKGRIPIHVGGGNNFVDVRDVAEGHLLAAEHGRAGERYILGGENLTAREFYTALATAAGRRFHWVRFPPLVGVGAVRLANCFSKRRPPPLDPAQVKLAALYFFYSSEKARRELGFQTRPLAESLRDMYEFWFAERGDAGLEKAA